MPIRVEYIVFLSLSLSLSPPLHCGGHLNRAGASTLTSEASGEPLHLVVHDAGAWVGLVALRQHILSVCGEGPLAATIIF